MKLTDLALIFVAIFLPIVIITYVNTSFVVKAEKMKLEKRLNKIKLKNKKCIIRM